MSEAAFPNPFDTIYEVLLERLRSDLPPPPPQTRHVSKEKLADLLGVETRTMKTWRSHGLPGPEVGREVLYDIEQVNRWIENHG